MGLTLLYTLRSVKHVLLHYMHTQQARGRGYLQRVRLAHETAAAVEIQAKSRGYLQRQKQLRYKQEKALKCIEEEQQDRAAVHIQVYLR
jgi:IQ calmodulin-binding motif